MLEADLKYLGQQILAARKKCGLTQKELAAQTKLSVKTIGTYRYSARKHKRIPGASLCQFWSKKADCWYTPPAPPRKSEPKAR